MKVLVTAGSTRTMIDKVRCLTNIFKGKTGQTIANYFIEQDQEVTLLTSGDICLDSYTMSKLVPRIIKYRTYDELYDNMKKLIITGDFDIIIHSAAVSDYRVVGTEIPIENGYEFIPVESSSKISSDYNELRLKLIKTEKIIDRIKDSWRFKGKLVKFKLQVDMSDEDLLDVARKSCIHSDADMIVANCLEWSAKKAYIMLKNGSVKLIERKDLPKNIFDALFEI